MLNNLFAYGMDVAQHGFGFANIGHVLLSSFVGLFFVLSGFNKLFNKGRHATITATLVADKVPFVRFNQWFVPANEFVGGIALIVGFFPTFFACALFVLISVACLCEAKARVDAYQPINIADRIDDYLYLPEVIYLLCLAIIIIS